MAVQYLSSREEYMVGENNWVIYLRDSCTIQVLGERFLLYTGELMVTVYLKGWWSFDTPHVWGVEEINTMFEDCFNPTEEELWMFKKLYDIEWDLHKETNQWLPEFKG